MNQAYRILIVDDEEFIRKGLARIVSGLRTAFDPAGVLVAPINGAA